MGHSSVQYEKPVLLAEISQTSKHFKIVLIHLLPNNRDCATSTRKTIAYIWTTHMSWPLVIQVTGKSRVSFTFQGIPANFNLPPSLMKIRSESEAGLSPWLFPIENVFQASIDLRRHHLLQLWGTKEQFMERDSVENTA